MYRIGIDIGGTFTDAMLLNEDTGHARTAKVPTTPSDPSQGFLDSIRHLLSDGNISPGEISYLVHATTIATNAIIEGKTARTGFITTDGFRDMLEIARQIRPSLYDLQFEKPPPIVPRYLSFGIPERLDAQGQVLVSLDEEAVRQAARTLKSKEVEAIAICFLHSYINPHHEIRAAEIIAEEFPDVVTSLSSDVAPEFREYFRASTTVINAATIPIVGHYLDNIEKRLHADGIVAELLVMQSNGGVLTVGTAIEKPVFMVESGPAAGAVAAANIGKVLGYSNLLSFDMGGTTAKTCLIQNGTPDITKDYQVGREAGRSSGAFGGADGYPIRTPVIDLGEIGAGGGSVAWIDPGGLLRVGPQSAGAIPGPVCYGQGGNQPTITDANLILGRLNPDNFLGGDITLNTDAAKHAIYETCAQPLGLSLDQAAHGIIEIANAAMVNAVRLVSVQRGFDPRDFVLVAFGGAGPVHANRIADELEVPTLMIPMSPGIFSATGLLVTDLKHDFSVTMIQLEEDLDVMAVEQAFTRMVDMGVDALTKESTSPDQMHFKRTTDMRYFGQSFELTIPVPGETLSEKVLSDVLQTFHREHKRAYGFAAPDEPVEFVNFHVTAIGDISKPTLTRLEYSEQNPGTALTGNRSVYFEEVGGRNYSPIYDRHMLSRGNEIPGPAIVEERDSTTVIHPGYTAQVDDYGNLLIKKDH